MSSRAPRRRIPVTAVILVSVLLGLAVPTGIAARVVNAVTGSRATAAFLDGPLPACRHDDLLAIHREPDDWARTLLDPIFRLEPDDVPRDVVPVREADIAGSGSIRLLVIDDLRSMARAARDDGVVLRVRSAFRSFDEQRRTFASLEAEHGRDWAERSAARRGHSEHQLGTTLDLDGGDDGSPRVPGGTGSSWAIPRIGARTSPATSPSRGTFATSAARWHARSTSRGSACASGCGSTPTRWAERARSGRASPIGRRTPCPRPTRSTGSCHARGAAPAGALCPSLTSKTHSSSGVPGGTGCRLTIQVASLAIHHPGW